MIVKHKLRVLLCVYVIAASVVFAPALALADGGGAGATAGAGTAASGSGSGAAAAAALGIAVPGAAAADGGTEASQSQTAGQTAGEGADTGNGSAETAPDVVNDTNTSEGEAVIVNETPDETGGEADNGEIGTKSAPGATGSTTSSRLDPREVKGSSMFNNLRGRLARFGADFFRNRRADTLIYAPVGPNYIVAPGDEVRINVWGYNEIRANLIVDRDGSIMLPQAGVVQAAGLSFEELKKAVQNAYGRILTDFNINVAMGKLHTINVYVTGQAARPGAYAISSMATLVDVLSQAGGPAASGSMRAIQVRRGNRKIATLDVYALLLRGSRNGDIRLADGDIIFIPTVGPLVAVAGNVKRPAIYELMNKEAKLKDIIGLAGGLTSGAFKGRLQIVRVIENAYRTAFESDLAAPSAKAQKLHDGDLLKVFAVPAGAYSIRIAGAVMQPGQFEIDEGSTTLADVLGRAGGLLYTAADEAELTRVEVSPSGPVTTRKMINLKDGSSGKFLLQRDDYFFVRTVPDWNIYRSASISGRVQYPGKYTVKRGERLSSLLSRAGGYADGAFTKGAIFIRGSIRASQQKVINDMANRLERELMAEGNQAVSTTTSQSDLEFTKAAIEQRTRYLNAIRGLKATGRLVVSLPDDPAKLKGTMYDVELQEGDRLYIPEHPGTIQVVGSVTTQSAFVYQPGMNFNDYVKMAGGYLKTASPQRTYILKADGSTIRAYDGKKPRVVEEGDFVVVPEKVVVVPTLRNTMSVIDIIYKMVLGVAAINYIF